jgi:hypothetical protein
MKRNTTLRATLLATVAIAACGLFRSQPAQAAKYLVFTIYNDTNVRIVHLYDRKFGEKFWGINDLTGPVQPGHSFYIRIEQNAYEHCPSVYRDVKVIFANGAVKVLSRIPLCEYNEAHINRASSGP